ncbi:RNA-directed DNA polymerase, eukaryota [Tanacetum coccineum]
MRRLNTGVLIDNDWLLKSINNVGKIDDYSSDDESNDVDEGPLNRSTFKDLLLNLEKNNDEGVIPASDKVNVTSHNNSRNVDVFHSVGNSGGILCIWDPNMFIKDHVSSLDYFVMGTWTPSSTKLLIISVYAPQELSEKRDLWEYISSLINRWDGKTMILGDFNEVRTEQERFGSNFNTQGLCLDRHLSDHRPIIMRESSLDYGPTPFCVFHSWFKMDGFDKLVEETWNSIDITYPNGLICMKKKLQLLKNTIKIWSKENKRKLNEAKFTAHNKLMELDKAIDQGHGNDDILNQRTTLMKELNDINSIDILELSQKAKVRSSIEGDENSKYFHGILNRKKLNLPFVESSWMDIGSSTRLTWDYLDDVLKSFGFSDKWRSWISSFLNSAKGSVLVNGIPTSEFKFHKGLKQGDPLSLSSCNRFSLRFGIEVCGGKEEDVGLGELGEGGKGVVSKIGEIGGDIGRELFGDRGAFYEWIGQRSEEKKEDSKETCFVARGPLKSGRVGRVIVISPFHKESYNLVK